MNDGLIGFLLGLFFGGTFGVFTAALTIAAGRYDEEREDEEGTNDLH